MPVPTKDITLAQVILQALTNTQMHIEKMAELERFADRYFDEEMEVAGETMQILANTLDYIAKN